jgi:ketosteroid isomerase-like protein
MMITKFIPATVLASLIAAPGVAHADVTEPELLTAATELARRWDENFAKDPKVMASLYTAEGVFISPVGVISRGREAIATHYARRVAPGAGHRSEVLEVHVQGDGGYGLTRFTAKVPGADGRLREARGYILTVYRKDSDGWHLSMAEPVEEKG